MFALNEIRSFYTRHYICFISRRDKYSIFIFLLWSFKQFYSFVLYKIIQEILLLLTKKETSLIFQHCHFLNFFTIILNIKVFISSVNDQDHALFDIMKSFKRSKKIFSKSWQFISSWLWYVGLINHQNNFNFAIDIQQSLNEKRVWYLILLSLIISKSRTVIECKILYYCSCWDRSLWVFLMTNLYIGLNLTN